MYPHLKGFHCATYFYLCVDAGEGSTPAELLLHYCWTLIFGAAYSRGPSIDAEVSISAVMLRSAFCVLWLHTGAADMTCEQMFSRTKSLDSLKPHIRQCLMTIKADMIMNNEQFADHNSNQC